MWERLFGNATQQQPMQYAWCTKGVSSDPASLPTFLVFGRDSNSSVWDSQIF
jgi:hypothetical protein